MRISVHLFASLRERAGGTSIDVEIVEGGTVGDLRLALERKLAGAGGLVRRCAVAVNEEYAVDDVPIRAGDVVAVIPPVSGGSCV